ncbi:MAG TPA: hypothetical protein PLD62_08410, partial [Candidatus Cloacimonadota bacterium]|nr:hypothetical protein [Candidatus Cloacimonadota bacterium]
KKRASDRSGKDLPLLVNKKFLIVNYPRGKLRGISPTLFQLRAENRIFFNPSASGISSKKGGKIWKSFRRTSRNS